MKKNQNKNNSAVLLPQRFSLFMTNLQNIFIRNRSRCGAAAGTNVSSYSFDSLNPPCYAEYSVEFL